VQKEKPGGGAQWLEGLRTKDRDQVAEELTSLVLKYKYLQISLLF
jgi:hypothetical protein